MKANLLFPINSNIPVIFVSVLRYASKLKLKMKLQTECTLAHYLFWREEAGTTIPIDSIELIDVVR